MAEHSKQRSRMVRILIRALITTVIVGGIIFVAAAFIGSSANGSDSPMRYTSLNYDAQVTPDGDLRVVEKVTMNLDERDDDNGDATPWRQLFQDYSNNQLPGQITQVSVTDDKGKQLTETDPMTPSEADDQGLDWNSKLAGKWYINPEGGEDGDQTEIGWNIPATDSADDLSFTIRMTFTQLAVKHPDVAEFQWEPISTSNTVPIDNLTGTMKFPKGINAKNSWGWLHYEGPDSTTARGANGQLQFSAKNVQPNMYVDIRTMFDSSAITNPSKTDPNPVKANILDMENQKEASWNAKMKSQAQKRLVIWILIIVAVWALIVVSVVFAFKTHHDSQYNGDLDYWREPPQMSPAAAAYLLNVMEPNILVSQNAMSATMLSLASKKAILLLPGTSSSYHSLEPLVQDSAQASSVTSGIPQMIKQAQGGKKNVTTIVLLPAAFTALKSLKLSSSESAALDLLKALSRKADNHRVFDLEEVKEPLKADRDGARQIQNQMETVDSTCENEFENLHASKGSALLNRLPVTLLRLAAAASLAYFGYTGQLVLGIAVGAIGIFASVFSARWGSNTVLTESGQEQAGKVLGLRNFMLDFSSFKDRGTQDLALWDRYLVYAAAFGISKEVAQQLVIAYPQISDQNWLNDNATDYPFFYSYYSPWAVGGAIGGIAGSQDAAAAMGNNFNFSDIAGQLNSSMSEITSTLTTATSDSSSSGGSFSGGGGFGGGGGGAGGGSFGGR